MPDRDIVHPGVSRFFQHTYRQLCEGVLPKDELVHNALGALTRSARSYGDEPVKFLQIVGKQLERLPDEPLLREAIDWRELGRWVDAKAQQVACKKRAVGLALRTAKTLIQEINRGGDKQELQVRLFRRYPSGVFEADLVEAVPLATDGGSDQQIVANRINSIRCDINDGINRLAERLTQNGTVTALQTPRRAQRAEPITLDTNLLEPSDWDGRDA